VHIHTSLLKKAGAPNPSFLDFNIEKQYLEYFKDPDWRGEEG